VNKFSGLATAIALTFSVAYSGSAVASISLSTGAGSAVTSVDASADFESTNALFDNPYLEAGLEFSRTGMTFNNNGCGYAGCPGHAGFPGFATTGNYMYGTGNLTSYFDIKTTGGNIFSGLEFVIGTGFSQTSQNVTWEAFLNNASVGSGSTTLAAGSVVGFSGAGGFDQLRYSAYDNGQNAAAFDSVRAQYSGAVPEPATWAMMIIGFGAAGSMVRRRRAVVA
jgi:hypothetical protein